VIATAVARLLFQDSVYTLGLRLRGVRTGSAADVSVLRKLTVEQVGLEPATVVHANDPFQRVLDLTTQTGATTFVVVDRAGSYTGMIVTDDIRTVLLQREAVPLLLVGELMRTDVPFVHNTDDLATAFDAFGRHEISHLPVCIANSPGRVIGVVSRAALMKRYQQGLAESR
jgi:CIC family chloride channel protein